MSLSGINKQRRSLKQTSWIIENILNKRGKRKQRPVAVDVLKHVCRQKDGSLVREVSDGEAYITAVFLSDAVKACLEEHDGSIPPNWDRALLLVTNYYIELQHLATLAESEYILYINGFRIWDLQEGFNRKNKIIFCMDDSRVKEKARQQWEELTRQMEPCSAESSMHLTQLLQEMAKDDSQTMENVSITTATENDFTMPSRSSLDRMFNIKEFIISQADITILDNITEWKNNYIPVSPIIEEKTSPVSSVNSLPHITSAHTLVGEVSSEEPLGKENDEMESIRLSCSDPSEVKNSEIKTTEQKNLLSETKEKQLDQTVIKNYDMENLRDVEGVNTETRGNIQCLDNEKSLEGVFNTDLYPSTQPFNPCLTPEKDSEFESQLNMIQGNTLEPCVTRDKSPEPDSGPSCVIEENLTIESGRLLQNRSSECRTCDSDLKSNATHRRNNTSDEHIHEIKRKDNRSPPQKRRKIAATYNGEMNSCINSSQPSADQGTDLRISSSVNVSDNVPPERFTEIKTSTPLPVDCGRNDHVDIGSSGNILIMADNCSFNSLISSEQENGQIEESCSPCNKSRCAEVKKHGTVSYTKISPNKHIINISDESLEDLHLISPGVGISDESSLEKDQRVDEQRISGFTSEGLNQAQETVEVDCILISSEERSMSQSLIELRTGKSGAGGGDIVSVSNEEESCQSLLHISPRQNLRTQHGSSPAHTSKVGQPSVNARRETTEQYKDTATSKNGLVPTEVNHSSGCEENQQVGNNTDLNCASQIRKKLLDPLEDWNDVAGENMKSLTFPEALVCQMIDYFTNI